MLIAGEASGDLLASELVLALRAQWPDAKFFGAGGAKMAAAGVDLAFDMTQHAVVGIPTIGKFLALKRLAKDLLGLAIQRKPDAVIGVDYGGFNLRFGHAVKEYVRQHSNGGWNPKLVQFVSPQVWASRPGRAWQLAFDYDLLLSIFPFEKDWYAKRVPKLRVEFVGHPMLDRIQKPAFPRPLGGEGQGLSRRSNTKADEGESSKSEPSAGPGRASTSKMDAHQGHDPIQSSDVSNQRNMILTLPANPSPAGAGEGGRRPGEGTRGNTEYCGEGRGKGESSKSESSAGPGRASTSKMDAHRGHEPIQSSVVSNQRSTILPLLGERAGVRASSSPGEERASDSIKESKLLLLLPGSRKSELYRHLPVMLGAWNYIKEQFPSLRARMVLPNDQMKALAARAEQAGVEIQVGNLPEALAQADLAITKTGTVTMECAFFGVPAVTMYKKSLLGLAIALRIVTVKSLTMPNLMANAEVYPEFIQDAATPENVALAALELLRNESRRQKIKSQLAQIISSLGEPGASRRAAAAIASLFL